MKKILISFFILFNSSFLFGQEIDSAYVVGSIVNEFNLLKSEYKKMDQVVVVYQWSNNSNPLVMGMEKIKGDWKMAIAPVRASIGRTGFIDSMHKQEGDGHTPEGLYALGQLFSYDSIVPTRLPYIVVNDQDKWIDDSTSDDYNKYTRGATNAKSFEHLLLNSIEYKYCTVIEYNTDPVIKGKGSAIFFHVATPEYKTTAGCVAIAEKDMLTFLNWFHPKKKRSILIKGLYVEAD